MSADVGPGTRLVLLTLDGITGRVPAGLHVGGIYTCESIRDVNHYVNGCGIHDGAECPKVAVKLVEHPVDDAIGLCLGRFRPIGPGAPAGLARILKIDDHARTHILEDA